MGALITAMEKKAPIWIAIVGALLGAMIAGGSALLSFGAKMEVLARVERKLDLIDQHETRIAVAEARITRLEGVSK